MQLKLTIILGLLWGICSITPAQVSKPDTLKLSFKRYLMKKYYDHGQKKYRAQVLLNKKVVFELDAKRAGHLQFVAIQNTHSYDITGDGERNFIFQKYLGGEEQANTWYILSLGRENFEILDTIYSKYGTPWLGDFGQDGRYEIVINDYVFANWNASFVKSPYERVVLEYRDKNYHMAPEWMLQSDTVLLNPKVAEEVKQTMMDFYEMAKNTYPYDVSVLGGPPEQRWGFISPKLWGTLMRLLYTGKGSQAENFLAQAWYSEIEGKEAFMEDFLKQIQKSPYWEQVQEMNSRQ